MIVTLATNTYDLDGFIQLKALATSSFGDITRRVNVVKTLDGGVAVNDGGSSQGDRSVLIMWKSKNKNFEDNVARVVENYSRLTMTFHEGAFEIVPTGYNQRGAESVLNLQILSKLA